MEDEKKIQLNAFLFTESGDLVRRYAGGDLATKKIDAEHVAGEKLTTFL
jgi:hypothetical protein